MQTGQTLQWYIQPYLGVRACMPAITVAYGKAGVPYSSQVSMLAHGLCGGCYDGDSDEHCDRTNPAKEPLDCVLQ